MQARAACIALGAFLILASCARDVTAPPTRLVPGVSPNGADITPPTLTALSFSVASINTTLGSASVTVNYTVTDDVSGAHEVSGGFQAPDTPQFWSSSDIAPDALSHSGSFTVTLPRYSDAGTWKLQMNIGDAAGNYRFYFPADLAAEGFPTDLDVVSDEDVTAPTLTAVSISPTTVNTTTGAHVVTVSYTVTDDKAGTVDVSTGMDGPTPPAHLSGSGSPPGGSTNFSGTVDITIPQNSELGTWKLVMNIGDAVGNYRFYTPTDLANAGFPTDVNVVDADRNPPALTALSFSSASINTTTGSASVTVFYTVTDDLSGAHEVSGGFQAPDTPQFWSSSDIAPDALSHSGSFTVTLPRYSDAGTWKLQMNIGDAAGNYRFYFPADLAAEGFPTDLDVVSDEDVTAPTLTAVSISPTTVNTTTGAHVVTVSYTVTDDKAGTVDVSTGMDGPTPPAHLSGSGSPPGGSTNFSGTVDITIPQNSELGTWKLVMNIGDAVGNYRFYTPTDLANAGFPTDVNVVATQTVAIDIRPGFDPNTWACRDAKGDVPVAILSSVSFDASTVDGTSLRFGRVGTEAAAQRLGNGQVQVQMKDVNKDGFTDAVYQFRFGDTGFSCLDIPSGQTTADVTATLTGMAGGLPIGGTGVLQLKRK